MISYKVDISINADGVMQEAQCECRAGQGPAAHCKHVAAVMLGLTCFCKTGDIVTEVTCTQVKKLIILDRPLPLLNLIIIKLIS